VSKTPNRKKKLRRPISKVDTSKADNAIEARLDRAASRVTPLATSEEEITKRTYLLRHSEIVQQAGIDYITDPESKSVEWWWSNDTRPYKRHCTLETFRTWSKDNEWVARRERFWVEIEERVLQQKQHAIILQRFKEIDLLTEGSDAMREYLLPLRDPHGKIKRHAEVHENGKPNLLSGLPMFPLELPTFEKFVKAYIDVDHLLMLKRGEATARNESMPTTSDRNKPLTALDPVSQRVAMTKEDIRALARYMLRRRQPELQDFDIENVIDAEVAAEADEGEEDGGKE
jgi:hypothetical protein